MQLAITGIGVHILSEFVAIYIHVYSIVFIRMYKDLVSDTIIGIKLQDCVYTKLKNTIDSHRFSTYYIVALVQAITL